ncbi:hypothetical protein BGX33_004878 [Mortierella sp. NVP41]|nr:hypothetical protein BGX33_004878 [Mortierella sp. NVP41]
MRHPIGSSWQGSRPNPDNAPAESKSSLPLNHITVRTKLTPPKDSTSFPTEESRSSASPSPTPSSQSSGLKIRIPRDLPNLPQIFRKPDSSRSHSSSSPSDMPSSPASSPKPRLSSVDAEPVYQQRLTLTQRPVDTSKRTHSDMLSGENTLPKIVKKTRKEKRHKADRQEAGSTHSTTPSPTVAIPVASTTPDTSTVSSMAARASLPLSRSNSYQNLVAVIPPLPKKSPAKRQPAKLTIPAVPLETPPAKFTLIADAAGPAIHDAHGKGDDLGATMTPQPARRHHDRSYSKSTSFPSPPTAAPIRLPTPMSINGATNVGSNELNPSAPSFPPSPKDASSSPLSINRPRGTAHSASFSSSQPLVDTASSSSSSTPASGSGSSAPPASNTVSGSRTALTQNNMSSAESPSDVLVANSPPPPPASVADAIEQNIRTNESLQLVRLGMSILDRLLSNPASKSFINKVPLNFNLYHAVISHPMDLTTIEQKLWKSFVVHQQSLSQPMNRALLSTADHINFTEGYSDLSEFERDLWLIFRNATHFNPPNDIIFKEAESFQTLFNGLLMANSDGLLPIPRMPQELYRPTLISFSRPGTLYLFRAQTPEEMKRKLTDTSADLFKAFHQPLIEVMNAPEPMSPERPRFARMYIDKNRSLLSSCRDDPNACLAILSNLRVGKVFKDPAGSPNPIKMVRLKARVMIGKPIGERHDMITVGDLDGPNAWIVFAGVKTLDLDMNVPSLFADRVRKIRHDVTPFKDTNVSAEHERLFLQALGLWQPAAIEGMLMPAEGTSVSAQTQALSAQPQALPAQPAPPSFQRLIQTPTISASVVAPTPTTNSSIERTEAMILPSLLLPTQSAPSQPAPAQPAPAHSAAASFHPTISLERSGSQELKRHRPVEESAPVNQDDTQHGAKRRHSLATNEQDSTSTIARQADYNAGPSHYPVEPMHAISTTQVSIVPPVPIQATPVAPPTVSATFDPVPAPVTVGQASELTSASTAPIATNVPLSMNPPAPTTSAQNCDSRQGKIFTTSDGSTRALTAHEEQMLRDLKVIAREKQVPYTSWSAVEPTLVADSAQGLFKRIYQVRDDEGVVVQNFKEMDAESFEGRVREVACLLKLRGLEGVGQIQSVIDDNEDHLVGLSMTKYTYTLKEYATNARRHPSPCQKLSLIQDMVAAMCSIHGEGMAHRDLSEVNIMIEEDTRQTLEDGTPRPLVRVIDFGKTVFIRPEEVKRWSMKDEVSDEELALLPLVVLPPDHGYKLYRSILTLPRTKQDHTPLPPVNPLAEDVYSLGVLIWRTFSGKSPWNGAIEDDLKKLRYLVSSDEQIKFLLEREVVGRRSLQLLLRCLTAEANTRSTIHELKAWLDRPEIAADLLKEFEILGGGRKKMRKNLD